MFIRFVSGAIDSNSQVRTGLFCAASELLEASDLPKHERDNLVEV